MFITAIIVQISIILWKTLNQDRFNGKLYVTDITQKLTSFVNKTENVVQTLKI